MEVALLASIPRRDLVSNGDKFLEPVKNSKKKLVEKMPPKSFKPKLESKFDENFNFISKFGDFFQKNGNILLDYSCLIFFSLFGKFSHEQKNHCS
jgi:hypothetical protein